MLALGLLLADGETYRHFPAFGACDLPVVVRPLRRRFNRTEDRMYQEYFQFSALPFPGAADASIFYSNPVYQGALETLRHGVVAKKGLMVLSGATGTGKTTLLKKLFLDLGPGVKPIWFSNGNFVLARVVKTVLSELASPPQDCDLPSMIEALRALLLRTRKAGRACCLVVEDAETLSSEQLESLRLLDNLTMDGGNLLQIILVGQPEFINKLNEPDNASLKQRIGLYSRLFILVRSQIERYVKFQLQAVGYPSQDLFDSCAMQRLAHYSGGIPRLINNLCDNALLAAYRSGVKQIGQALIDEVAKDMGLLADSQIQLPAQVRRGLEPPSIALRPEWQPEQNMLATLPRRQITKVAVLACLGLLALGGASWALYSGAGASVAVREEARSTVTAEANQWRSSFRPRRAQADDRLAETQQAGPAEPAQPTPRVQQESSGKGNVNAMRATANARASEGASSGKPILKNQAVKTAKARAVY